MDGKSLLLNRFVAVVLQQYKRIVERVHIIMEQGPPTHEKVRKWNESSNYSFTLLTFLVMTEAFTKNPRTSDVIRLADE
jgi:hypothetical protein